MDTNSASSSEAMTSTSHTMTGSALSKPISKGTNVFGARGDTNEIDQLRNALEPENRYTFIQPTLSICDAALSQSKSLLDGFAAEICEEQATRLKQERKDNKRKRGEGKVETGELLRVRRVHTDGFAVEQVWEQARRVIDALRSEVAKGLEDLGIDENGLEEKEEEVEGEVVSSVRFGKDGFEVESGDESLESDVIDGEDFELGEDDGEEMELGEDEELVSEQDEDSEYGGAEDDADMDDLLQAMEGHDDYEEEAEEAAGEEDEDEDDEDNDDDDEEAAETFVPDPHGLNDGFFSIDDFNKQTEFLEQQDAAGDVNTGEASDEEDIDWDANPMATIVAPVSSTRRARAMDVEEESDSDDGDGPTFGNVDLNAPEGDSEASDQEMEEDVDEVGDNTNEVLYKDFFEPPPRKASKGERQTKYLERQSRKPKPPTTIDDADQVERAMADVRRDLFDESEHDDSGDALSDLDPADPKSRKSAHERRQSKIAEEIRRLEAASVAKREWTLSGEARAADRPLNSLLEEDLDFERTGKPVPVITAEVSESIEELIKRRIIAQEFDEVLRRRPDSDSVPATARRGQFDLEDTKPQQSLAEMYEEEHIKNTNPDTYVSANDEKLKKQHLEIEGLWKDVSAKLDALSSWHYKPKPPAPSLTVVSDVATVAMEDAQPAIGDAVTGSESMLAPQEIYKAGAEKNGDKTEIVLKSGVPVSRGEMTREEKLRRRRREKERIKKRGGGEAPKVGKDGVVQVIKEGKRAKEQRETKEELKRAGVVVIGKKGERVDIEGNKVKSGGLVNGAGGYKL